MAIWSRYLEEVWYQKQVIANWEPNEDKQLGWYGTFKNGRFDYRGSLGDQFSIKFEVLSSASGPVEFASATGADVTTKFDLKADPGGPFKALGKGDLGFRVTFSEDGTVVTRSTASTHERIRDPRAVRREILRLTRNNEWNDDWYFIESRMVAPAAVVLAAEGERGSAEVKTNLKIPKVKGSVGFKVAYAEEAIATYESNDGMVMQFRPTRVRVGLLERFLRWITSEPEPDEQLDSANAVDRAIAKMDDDMVDALFTGYGGGNDIPDDGFGAGYAGNNDPRD